MVTAEIIKKYLGIPFKEGGRDKDGLDCWGFVKYFYENEMGISIVNDFDIMPGETRKIVKAFDETKDSWLKLDRPIEGCAVALSHNKKVHHVGVWLISGCLHAVQGTGVVYNNTNQLKRNGFNLMEYYKCRHQ